MGKYKLSPSRAHRYLNCTKSLEFEPEEKEENAAMIRGKILHEYAEKKLKQIDTINFVKEHKINSYEKSLIDAYVNAVHREEQTIGALKMVVEKGNKKNSEKNGIQLYGNEIHLVIDVMLVSPRLVSVIDLKTGRVPVEVNENEQLIFYAYYALQKYPSINTIFVSIFQNFKMKTIKYRRKEVLDWFVNKYDTFVDIANDKLSFSPSDKACKYCPIKDTCMARAKWIVGGKK